jgi:hypothetical protein
MAEIVLGLAASHTPQLSSGVNMWEDHGERDRSLKLLGKEGEWVSFDDLVARTSPDIAEELLPEVWEAKYQRVQAAIEEVKSLLAEARPDVVVVIGDDQMELFRAQGIPTFALFTGEELWDEPRSGEEYEVLRPGQRAAQWAIHGDRRNVNRTDGKLGFHLLSVLAEDGFDVTQFSEQPPHSLGHAFTFPRYRLGLDPGIPIVPVFINTYVGPNVPSASRAFALGESLRRGLDSWQPDVRVAVVTSGGLTHFVIDESLDQQVLDGLVAGDRDSFGDLPRNKLRSGNSEILNWVTAAGMLQDRQATVLDYVPGYRSLAGTGTGMAFAFWK